MQAETSRQPWLLYSGTLSVYFETGLIGLELIQQVRLSGQRNRGIDPAVCLQLRDYSIPTTSAVFHTYSGDQPQTLMIVRQELHWLSRFPSLVYLLEYNLVRVLE